MSLFDILALPENDCLNFSDMESLEEADQREIAVSATRILQVFFLEKVTPNNPFKKPSNPAIQKDVRLWAEENMINPGLVSENRLKKFDRIMDTSANVAQYFYPLAAHETQLLVAITTVVLYFINDELPEDPRHRDDVCNFTYQHWTNEHPTGPCAKLLRDIVAKNVKFFGSQDPALGALMGTTISTYIDSCVMTFRFENLAPFHFKRNDHHHHNSNESCAIERFPLYYRTVNGVPMPYLLPIFKISKEVDIPMHYWECIIPDLVDVINLTNDLLSFPKEVLAADTWIYMTLVTKSHRQAQRLSRFKGSKDGLWTFRDSLFETLQRVLNSYTAVDQAFTSCIKDDTIPLDDRTQVRLANNHWQAFKHGYIAMYFNLERYRLKDLTGC
jgi:hypothetical protein